MTIKEFLDQFNGAPYDDEELAEIASKVEGEVGERAHSLIEAINGFDAILESINFERG